MRGLRVRRLSSFLVAALAVTGVAACSSGTAATTGSTGKGPELSNINVYTLDTPDVAAVWIAQQDGFFKQAGLNVKVTYEQSTADSQAGLIAHTVDFALQNYVGMFTEMRDNPHLDLRIVADDQQGTPDTGVLLVAKNSHITSVADLKGKAIGFPSAGINLGALELDEQLQGYGIGPNSYSHVILGFANMIGPLERGEIDAAYVIQPFITIMESKIGAHPLVDLNTGATKNFPSSGWTTSEWFVQHYPRTVAAFQRAVEKGQQIAASDPALVRKLLPKFIPTMTPQIANVMPLQAYNTTLSLTRLQRVVTVMQQFGALPKNFNLKSLIVPLPPGA